MSTRNPMNDRNADGGPKGKTRRSASSAKPASRAASSVYVPSPDSKKSKAPFTKKKAKGAGSVSKDSQSKKSRDAKKEAKLQSRAERDAEREEEWALRDAIRGFHAESPEYLHWRRIWWGFIIAGIVLAVAMLFMNFVFPGMGTVGLVMGLIAWAILCVAILIDMKKVKPAKERAFFQSSMSKSFRKSRRQSQK